MKKKLSIEEMKFISTKRNILEPVFKCSESDGELSCSIQSAAGGKAIPVHDISRPGVIVGLICDYGTHGSIECCDGYVVAQRPNTNEYTCVKKSDVKPPKPEPEEPKPNPGEGSGSGSGSGSGGSGSGGSGSGGSGSGGNGSGSGETGGTTPPPPTTNPTSGRRLL